MKENANRKCTTNRIIVKDKMRVLSDFGICEMDDAKMKARLEEEIRNHPDKDPRTVLDLYCRPMIQAVANSWV